VAGDLAGGRGHEKRGEAAVSSATHLPWLDAFVAALPGSDDATALDELGGMMLSMSRLDEEVIRRLWVELALAGAPRVVRTIADADGAGERDGPSDRPVWPPYNPALARALQCIDASLGDPGLSVNRIADAAGVSRRWVCRLFARHVRLSIMGFVHALRVFRAAEALRSPQLSTKEVAALVGYRRTSDLDAHFRRRTGVTPTSYRRMPAGRQLALLLGLASPGKSQTGGSHARTTERRLAGEP
jgi:AraC-like DNA-binding protein